MGRELETRYTYSLLVAPSFDSLKRGIWIREGNMDAERAKTLYRAFKGQGLVCIITYKRIEELSIECSDKDVAKFWGVE